MNGCGYGCGVCNFRGTVSPSSRCRSLGHVVRTAYNGTRQVGIVVPGLCNNHRRHHGCHRDLSYTFTLRRLRGVNIGGVIAFSTRSPQIYGTIPLVDFSGLVPTCRILGTVFHTVPSFRPGQSAVVIIDPSRNTLGHGVCCTIGLNIRVNVFCGHHSCSHVIGNHGPVITRRCLNGGIRNGSIFVTSSVVTSNRSVLSVTCRLGGHGTGHVFTCTACTVFATNLSGFSRTCGGNVVRNIFNAGLACHAPRLLDHR